MTESLTFLHTADLHLGAPFRGLAKVSPAWAARLVQAIAEAFDRVIDTAISRKVDFVVIAGDVFDASRASYGDYLRFFEGMRALGKAGIPAYLITGNHDPYTSWQQSAFSLTENAHMLPADKPGFELYRRDGKPLCIIGGRGYYNQSWPIDECIADGITRTAALTALQQSEPDVAQAPFAIGMLHTGLDLDPVKAPVNPSVLLSAGMDYWACGHIHMCYIHPSEADPRIAFSGCIQGRDIKETGPRGVQLVTLSEGAAPQLEFIPTASVVWQRLRVDVSDCATLPEISGLIMRELFRVNGKAHCEEMISRIVLTGTTALHEVLSRPDVIEDLRKHVNDSYAPFFCDTMLDETQEPRDKQALREEGLFPAVFLRVADTQRSLPEEQVAFLQQEFLDRGLQMPSICAGRVGKLSEQAEDLVLDMLSQGEER